MKLNSSLNSSLIGSPTPLRRGSVARTLPPVRYPLGRFLCAAVAAGLIAVLVQGFAQTSADGQLRVAHLSDCALQSGQILHDCRVGYRTFGRLNAAGDNAVLMPTWLYGTSADLTEFFGSVPSARQLVDTSRFLGIAVDALGNGVSSSPSNTLDPQHGPDFPAITTRDIVQAEYRLSERSDLHLAGDVRSPDYELRCSCSVGPRARFSFERCARPGSMMDSLN